MNIRPDTRARILALRAEGMSVVGISRRMRISHITVRGVLGDTLTPLNIRTNQLHETCKRNGGCVPSGELVRRSFPLADVDLPVCRNCGVPIVKRAKVALTVRDNSTLFGGQAA
jgi:hypothetical protein